MGTWLVPGYQEMLLPLNGTKCLLRPDHLPFKYHWTRRPCSEKNHLHPNHLKHVLFSLKRRNTRKCKRQNTTPSSYSGRGPWGGVGVPRAGWEDGLRPWPGLRERSPRLTGACVAPTVGPCSHRFSNLAAQHLGCCENHGRLGTPKMLIIWSGIPLGQSDYKK